MNQVPKARQLIGSGPDNDLPTLGCNALAGDDVLIPVDVVTFDALVSEATVTFASSLGDGIYRLFVCDTLEDPSGTPLPGGLRAPVGKLLNRAHRAGEGWIDR